MGQAPDDHRPIAQDLADAVKRNHGERIPLADALALGQIHATLAVADAVDRLTATLKAD